MNIPLKLPNPQQHERLFLDDAIQRYKSKLISAADFILSLTSIYRPKGQKLNIPSAKAFYTQFNIPKSTFYKALKRLESLPELGFHWEPTGGISLWRGEAEEIAAPAPEKKEPTYVNLKQLPAALRNEFEAFVKNQWRKIKGEEIRSFHRFVEKATDFQNWWTKFQEYKTTATATATPMATPTVTELESSKHTSFSIPNRLKSLFDKKPT